MSTSTDYCEIEYNIADISHIINKQQKYVKELIYQRINKAYQYDAYVKGQQLMLNIMMKQKNELENKLQSVHEERYNEFKKCNAFSGINDVMNIAFQYAHPKDKLTNKYVVEKRIRIAKNYYPNCISNNTINSSKDIVREYKKDRFDAFLDCIIANLKILKFICVIAFIIIKFVYIFTYIYYKIYINLIQ
jgi:hypothetical protein